MFHSANERKERGGMGIEINFPEKIMRRINLSEKYFSEAKELLKEGDYVQASEKLWGAASQMVKAVAAKRNLELRSHSDLNRFVAELRREANEPEIRRLWQIATSLHQNFYVAWLPVETVRESVEDIKRFREMLERMLQAQPLQP